jgi:hypothetical protein
MMREINFAQGKISVDGDWYDIRELSDRILDRLENGENDITKFAEALRDLDAALKFWY